jgi:hypothetical protein
MGHKTIALVMMAGVIGGSVISLRNKTCAATISSKIWRSMAQTIEGVSTGCLLPLLACGKAIPPTVEIAERKEGRELVWRFVRWICDMEASSLRRRGTSDAPTWAHAVTCILK